MSKPLKTGGEVDSWCTKCKLELNHRIIAMVGKQQVELAEGFELAKAQAAPVIESDVRRDIGGDEQRVSQVSTHYSAVTFKHLLLPVYVGAYRFRERVFQVVVNGRTGEVQGERPYSFWKIFFFVLFLLAVVGVLIFVFGGSEQ